MSADKKLNGKSEYDVNNVRVRKSYYTFSKDYPHLLGKQSKAVRNKRKKLRSLRIAAAVLCFTLIAVLTYFAINVGLEISYKPETSENSSGAQTQDGDETLTLLDTDGMRAMRYPYDKLGNTKYMKSFVSQIKHKDANSVVIDFKTSDGHLAYSSKNETAIMAKCSLYDNETVRKTVSYFKSKNINLIAGIYCFEDSLVSSMSQDMAVKYMNSDVIWLDGFEEENGRSWLNPYSKAAVKYILDIISEVNSFGVSGFILESVCFPSDGDIDSAGYPGEKNKSGRNARLLSFVEQVRASIPNEKFLLIMQDADDTLTGNEQKYYGSISRCSANGICADTAKSPAGYVIDRKTKYASLMTLLSNMKGSLDEHSVLIPTISEDDYTWTLASTLSKNGYNSYIIY